MTAPATPPATRTVCASSLACMLTLLASAAGAQSNQFGAQDRADAASRMIVLGVQQAVSALPPAAGQAFTFTFDPALESFVRSRHPGPTALRSAETVGVRELDLRVALSHLEMSESFGPIPYLVSFDSPPAGQTEAVRGVGSLGLKARARVTVVGLSASYGAHHRLQLDLNVPIVVTDARAAQRFSTDPSTLGRPPRLAPFSGPRVLGNDVEGAVDMLDALLESGGLVLREEALDELGFDFNEGTHAGLGRISLGTKATLLAGAGIQLAFAPEVSLPSPNERDFAGSESFTVLPRLIGSFDLGTRARLHVDAGYDYDFDNGALRRAVWSAGFSTPIGPLTIDAGAGGSLYESGLRWTPERAHGEPNADFPPTTLTALGNTRLGNCFLDALAGVKWRLGPRWVLAGAVQVPLTNDGFRPDVVGTLAVEAHRR